MNESIADEVGYSLTCTDYQCVDVQVLAYGVKRELCRVVDHLREEHHDAGRYSNLTETRVADKIEICIYLFVFLLLY